MPGVEEASVPAAGGSHCYKLCCGGADMYAVNQTLWRLREKDEEEEKEGKEGG